MESSTGAKKRRQHSARLSSGKIVQTRPGSHGPTVVELPIERARHPVAVSPPMFHAVANPFRLQHHAQVDQ